MALWQMLASGTDSWLTVKLWPPMVSELERVGPALGATVKPTVPVPVPLPPTVMVSQSALLVADHGQTEGVATVTVPEPPPAATDWLL